MSAVSELMRAADYALLWYPGYCQCLARLCYRQSSTYSRWELLLLVRAYLHDFVMHHQVVCVDWEIAIYMNARAIGWLKCQARRANAHRSRTAPAHKMADNQAQLHTPVEPFGGRYLSADFARSLFCVLCFIFAGY